MLWIPQCLSGSSRSLKAHARRFDRDEPHVPWTFPRRFGRRFRVRSQPQQIRGQTHEPPATIPAIHSSADAAAGGERRPPVLVSVIPGGKQQGIHVEIGDVDVFHDEQGNAISCPSCHLAKGLEDPAFPGKGIPLWRNDHGHPHDATRHHRICMYCDCKRCKQHLGVSVEQFVVEMQTPEAV